MAFYPARDMAFNPADPDQVLILYASGYIESRGGAPLPVATPQFTSGAGGHLTGIARRFQITDWTEPSGYVMDGEGNVHEFGAAAPVNEGLGPIYQRVGSDVYRAFQMNTAANGQGYIMSRLGRVFHFGGASALGSAIAHGSGFYGSDSKVFTTDRMIDMTIDIATERFYQLDRYGDVWARGGAPAITDEGAVSRSTYIFLDLEWNWTEAYGYKVSKHIGPRGINNPPDNVTPSVPRRTTDYYRRMKVIDWGLTGNPFEFYLLGYNGSLLRIIASAPPTFTIAAPTGTITTTTRPDVEWEFDDPNDDRQNAVHLRLFTDAQYGAGGFNAQTSTPLLAFDSTQQDLQGIDHTIWAELQRQNPNTPLDLPNDTYRWYGWAEDSAGDTSSVDNEQFTINVTPWDPPTITATPDPVGGLVEIELETIDAGADYVTVERRNPDGTWVPVRGAQAVPMTDPITIEDFEMPHNRSVRYRAASLQTSPWLMGEWAESDDVVVEAGTDEWWLKNPLNPGENALISKKAGLTATRTVHAGTFHPLNRETAVVVDDGRHAALISLSVFALTGDEQILLQDLLSEPKVLQLVAPSYDHVAEGCPYVKVTGDIAWTHQRGRMPDEDNDEGIMRMKEIAISFVEVAAPADTENLPFANEDI